MITATLIGDREVIDKMAVIGDRAKHEMRAVIKLVAMELVKITKLKLSDDVLHVRSGRLRRSILPTFSEDANGFVGVVGTNVSYAKYHELGFEGQMQVREHLRTIKKRFGKSIKGGPVTFTVKAHVRNVKYPAHSFLASSLAEVQPLFVAEVEKAKKRALIT